MAVKSLFTKFIGGSIGNTNVITSTEYKYDEETFEYLGFLSHYDNGKEADERGYYSFDSVKAFIESKGKTELIKREGNQLS